MSTQLEIDALEGVLNLAGEMKLEFAGTVIGGPRGPKGADGVDAESATFQIGTVQAGASGSQPVVTLTGTFPDYVLNFTLPRGIKGEDGEPGPQGQPGTGTATVYRSPDIPDNGTGENGDFWFVLKS